MFWCLFGLPHLYIVQSSIVLMMWCFNLLTHVAYVCILTMYVCIRVWTILYGTQYSVLYPCWLHIVTLTRMKEEKDQNLVLTIISIEFNCLVAISSIFRALMFIEKIIQLYIYIYQNKIGRRRKKKGKNKMNNCYKKKRIDEQCMYDQTIMVKQDQLG